MMTTNASPVDGRGISLFALAPFLLITFGLAWGILGMYIFLPERMTGMFGAITGRHPLFFLAVWAPAVAAFIVVFHKAGTPGLKRYLSRFRIWRCPPVWWGFLIAGVPLVFIAGSAWKGNLLPDPFPFASFQALMAGLLLAVIKGPVEEFGWRGLALPLLQRKMAPLWAGLILGVIWGFWHLPAFLLSGTQQSQWSLPAFFTGCIALSVIATALFNASRGSILISAVFHFTLMNPVLPDAQPYDTYLFIAVAVLTAVLNRKSMLSKEGAFTDVIPDSPGGDMERYPGTAADVYP